jgi:hypothetical protein
VARTIDTDVHDSRDVMRWLTEADIDMDDVGLMLENQGARFQSSYQTGG